MTTIYVLHWIARHWFLAWILAAAAFVIGWAIFLAWFGESDEQRDARRRKEAHDRTIARYNAIAEEYKRRERAKHDAELTAAVEAMRKEWEHDALSCAISVMGTDYVELERAFTAVPTDYDELERMREAEGSDENAA